MRNNTCYDYLIVGAGLFGATFAYHARKAGCRCLVIDRRRHIGGNTYCDYVDGIWVHRYGPHIFHTNDAGIWRFVNSIVDFNRYTNSPMAEYEGKLYNLPFNMNTFYQIWGVRTPSEARAIIAEQSETAKKRMKCDGILNPRNLEEQALLLVGRDIYEKLIKGYTQKQWGRPCTELPAWIIRRLPVRFVFDNNYFNDMYQGVPIGGYNKLVGHLLEGVDVRLGADFFADRAYWESVADRVVFTGCIDRFFNNCCGRLQYRTLQFDVRMENVPDFQGCAVINHTSETVPYTRTIEHKHFEKFGEEVYELPHTVVSTEYPLEWRDGMEPLYPVNDAENARRYECYKAMAEKCHNVIFGGRLAEYRYYDMAPVMLRAKDIWRQEMPRIQNNRCR